MARYTFLTILVLLTPTCAVLEGRIEWRPPQFIQSNGLLAMVCTGVLIGWMLKIQSGSLEND